MGIVGDALNKLWEGVQDVAIFFFGYTLIVFIAGQWFGVVYSKTEIFWYPLYALAFLMVIKILIDIGRGRRASAKAAAKS